MSEQKDKLREEILGYIRAVVEDDTECELQTDLILALFPDKKDIEKQERERLIEWGNETCTEHSNDGWRKRECPQCWQALGEK